MLNVILNAVTQTLTLGGVNAFREFPQDEVLHDSGAFVCVGSEKCKCLSPGFGDYLGVRTDILSGAITELFGKRLEITLNFEVYAPYHLDLGEETCVECADKVTRLLDKLPSGLRVIDMIRGEVKADDKLSLFHCACSLRCMAFFIAEKNDEEAEFLDFILKGAVGSANQ